MFRARCLPRETTNLFNGFNRHHSTIVKNSVYGDFKSIPKDKSEIPTHELLQRVGFIKQPAAGLVHWMPNGLRVLRKLESILHRRMGEIGFEEVSLSSLSPSHLWEQTGRWGNTELFKLKDAKRGDLCLVATCEEEITDVVNKSVQSYKQLPVRAYQITRKYRDEKRPRFGLLRGREFVMKDGYSFDIDAKSAMKTFDDVNGAYRKIFQDLKVPFKSAAADSGSIGGDLSLEWHFVHPTGEDTLMECDSCGEVSNVEKTIGFPIEGSEPAKEASVKYFTTKDNSTLIAMYFPSDRIFNPSMAKSEIDDIDLDDSLTNDQVLEKFKKDADEVAVKGIIRVIDPRVTSASKLPDFPDGIKFQRNNFTSFTDISIVDAHEGEVCGGCNNGHLQSMRAIEVGHTFYLGTRYSAPLNAGFKDRDQKPQLFEMGCYGIGVSRLLASVAEVLRDPKGIAFPASIAPYEASVIVAKNSDESEVSKLVEQLDDAKVDFLVDKRDSSLPMRIRESAMVGVPLCVIVGGSSHPKIEIEVRSRPFTKKDDKWAWEVAHEKNAKDWQWDSFVDARGNEKHVVSLEKVAEVLKVLLKDL
ncbi:putative proline--tRNA ligase [Saccharomycopsis crataegensis]|uniref:proline--tRNA ligase n=1 Tax=Saccharomycopsis crataegensis TaxID=43959 RepID=A0AAV5QTE5_9ASCO|nr:putative proline--tRNA ligase [Saccharomycopsis crataegensis]